MAVIGIILSLALLIFMAYKGFSVIFFAPIFALLAALFSGMALLPTYTEIFLPNLGNYVKIYFPFFLLGAVFGKAMEQSGSAKSIAKTIVGKLGKDKAIFSVVLSAAILTYGGVSLFVVAFAVYPFAASIFKEADIPKRLIPATIALGAFSFTMDSLPGTPQIQNTIPMKYFNTDLYAAPVFGTLGSIILLVGGIFYLEWRKRSAQAAGEGYGTNHKNEPSLSDDENIPPMWISIIPLASVLIITLVLQKIIFPNWDILSWVTQKPYSLSKEGIVGSMNNWALIIALIIGSIIAFCINIKSSRNNLAKAINAGAIGSLLAVMNTASEVGFGNVIKTLPGFKSIANALININPNGSPLLSEAVSVNVLSGVTGSASGGMSIVLDMFGKKYAEWAANTGISPELLHRVASMASGGMDTLPHNGAVITLLGISGLTHKQSYKDIFAVTLLKAGTCFLLIFLQSIFHFI
ncbi:symporter [Clostridium pasteurianum DSM 525 = ATCC 6013]|uniref:Citrate transporter n=1 Tax=Clostridium pasteurianum DSM 525 = ATCC 6013 TaxID=1262449 RepID=A0A0H3JAZ9_CLOPA|nr:GntP family permease [Clostridium pasteurianum]AJA50028.1 symporter [Clostridium pasteurianum DSM 525 = ATCC 6013]AJA54016.1 symporter [Clostridium pasteurianum DSM 525 = ATCC 6013]AOZ77158.1 transporter [Clostridium pasteurianum DSM 525 = ATCC 6013]AOZ80955.1 transporter [Clostridium pasteurianum]ELP59263.1 citrate transporter [Clostridium pasteurianum DSM 525 = ATCC 6013]